MKKYFLIKFSEEFLYEVEEDGFVIVDEELLEKYKERLQLKLSSDDFYLNYRDLSSGCRDEQEKDTLCTQTKDYLRNLLERGIEEISSKQKELLEDLFSIGNIITSIEINGEKLEYKGWGYTQFFYTLF